MKAMRSAAPTVVAKSAERPSWLVSDVTKFMAMWLLLFVHARRFAGFQLRGCEEFLLGDVNMVMPCVAVFVHVCMLPDVRR